MAREDEAESDVALIRTYIKRIVDRKQLNEPGPPIGGRRGCPIRAKTKPACHPLEAGSGSEPDSCALVAQDHETIRAAQRSGAQAKAQPSDALGGDQVMLLAVAMVGKRLKARRKRDRGYVCGFDYDHVGRGLGRPQRWTGARVGFRGSGESSAPTARPDPPLRLEQSWDPRQSCLSFRHNPCGKRHCAAGTPAQNPHSHGLGNDLRSLVTARKYPWT